MGQASNTKWHGEHLARLIHWPISKLMAYYPAYTKDTLKGKKSYWKKQIREGKIPMPPKPNPESNPEVQQGRLKSTWEVAMRGEDGEWNTHTLHAYDHTENTVETYEPVEPAKIRPTKLKRAVRASKFILAYGDGQVDFRRIIDPVTGEQTMIPLHNVEMHRIIMQLNATLRPETTVNLGDFADMAALSRFSPDSDHFHKTLGPSLSWIHNFYAQFTADNPDASHNEVGSNHEARIKKQVLSNLPALHDFVRPGDSYPMMTYYHMANLGMLGINFISGYGNAEFVYGEDQGIPIVFKHGTHSSSNPGATVRKEAQENPEVHVVRGHGHAEEHVTMTDRRGRKHFYYMLGSACINNGPVPGYHSSVDDHNQPTTYHNRRHTNSFAVIEDYGNGEYQIDIVNVFRGVAHWRGQVFSGDVPYDWENNFGYLPKTNE